MVFKLFQNASSSRRRLFVLVFLLSLLCIVNLSWMFWQRPIFQQLRGQGPYYIAIWKHEDRMKRRFLRSYGDVNRDPFEHCPVKNCLLRTGPQSFNDSHAVLFHLHQTRGPQTLPVRLNPQQYWIFFTDESPLHTFLATKRYKMKDYNGIFNWSMTYRTDSDIPVPYGRTLNISSAENVTLTKNYAQGKNYAAILGSNCGGTNNRWAYVRELQKHFRVDIYGGCGKFKCAGHFTKDCPSINKYKFYLAFENSNCREYLTEKLWWNAYHKELIPVVMGAPIEDYEKLCPPHSFIHTDSFKDPADLAQYLNYLDKNDTAYNEYFRWKYRYKVRNEHGYFGSLSLHLCHICEALNTKGHIPKLYNHLEHFWSSQNDCRPPHWHPPK